MRFPPSRPLLAAVAIVFAASLLLHTGAFFYYSRSGMQPEVEFGFESDYVAGERVDLVRSVYPGSPAQAAGLRAGDRVEGYNGLPITGAESQARVWLRSHPGDRVQLTLRRPGSPNLITLTGVFRRRLSDPFSDFATRQLQSWFPLPFLAVGLAVLFLRLEDLNAWLLALLFGGVVASRGWPMVADKPAWWPAAMAYQSLFTGIVGPVYYCFHARFPTRYVDRRVPWLKWVAFGLGLICGLGGLRDGRIQFPIPPVGPWDGARLATLFVIVCLILGLASFAANFFRSQDPEARRRLRLLFWGAVIGLGPSVLLLLVQDLANWQIPAWLNALRQDLLVLLPLSFAYAVVVHRVLEIPVLLKRSARYLLVQRGFTLLLALAAFALVAGFAVSIPQFHSGAAVNPQLAVSLGAVFGTALVWSGTAVHRRVSGRIDRAFFRSSYDARLLLEDLAEKIRTATTRGDLARLLESHIDAALKPRFLIVHLDAGKPGAPEPPECVIPILGRDGAQLGLLLLGSRRSEEPYSGEDRRLLASVASQAAIALENMQLAEEIAARIEGERRTAREMEIARDVQTRLLPQSPPRLETLECAASCIQARAVGGDYYDFLELGPHTAALLLADVSGKGVHAALLVAHLQACLRTQAAMMPGDPVAMLRQVNQMLYRSTAPQHFATLFFGLYDDTTRQLVYVNCGHNPSLLMQPDSTITRLEPTATVIGAFDAWEGAAGAVRLDPGAILAIFSDGITEAPRGEEDFGELRLIQQLQARAGTPAGEIVSGILRCVQDFTEGAQADDLTLLVARAR